MSNYESYLEDLHSQALKVGLTIKEIFIQVKQILMRSCNLIGYFIQSSSRFIHSANC